ncbi:hypothetical protein [Amycolatopsis saalfeldensis]|uniref:Alpha/beta hydrolase family protein n=1 Tax=Amycolatopsis saalfeldensis TaxID=394193 RepID=A0A1H8QDV2_9PSEU|nr:hypothetical protein [Amycolatopsis saalfeldensis]SEO52181.1 hypothetical protein SAMN04489732_101307 [Amycolatopsis saalfeldensis]
MVSVPVTCERGGFTVVMPVDGAGMVHGLRLTPPRYAAPRKFTEQEVTVGSGPLVVPGTVTLPRGRGPWPGVVLLTAGPFDRDLAAGPNKPFKGLAWGLAGRGVAVVGFDKVNHVHGEVAAEPGFTMVDEYVLHAVAAVRLLQAVVRVARFARPTSRSGRGPRPVTGDPGRRAALRSADVAGWPAPREGKLARLVRGLKH